MGLDMYLTKKTYIGAKWEHSNVTGIIDIKKGGRPVPISFKRVGYIIEEVGYWRKANQIHNWFVQNVQGGNDDCGDYYVDLDKLKDLLNICKQIKKHCPLVDGAVTNGYAVSDGVQMPIVEIGKEMSDSDFAAKLLPVKAGFFFGGTDYDQYYMDDIDSSIEIIEAILEEGSEVHGDYYYHSSW